MAVHSKRAAEITAEMERLGYSSYGAKGIVARNNRDRKRHEPVGALMPRWHAELASVGWPVADLARAVEEARPRSRRPPQALREPDRQHLVEEVLAPDGPLAERKVFSRRDVIAAAAPRLFGHDPNELAEVARRVLANAEAVPLVAVPSASERPYATATTIAREQAIAAAVEVDVARTDAPAVHDVVARRALGTKEAELGTHLTVGQRAAVLATATSGRGVELIVGVAGSGKTTALAALRDAYETEGYRVLGTSTSGQAARTLGRAAGIEPSRTLASLTWRLEHGQLSLDHRSVVVLDEAAMTEDRHMLQLLHHAAAAHAKVVMVGDHRQLGAVGPGGGFEALVGRYGGAVHVLADNVRQRNVAERAALAQLRDGDVAKAVAWYARNRRIVVAPDRAAIEGLVEGWAADVAEHSSVAMYAYRRANVAELNRSGREVWRGLGRLEGPELVAPGGTRYAVGDRVVTLAPAAGGQVVTSETGTVVAVRSEAMALSIRMDDDNEIRRLEGAEIGAGRLAHGYAVTVHRSQGSTVERAHAMEDGGGRELAYVKMSRAKERSTVYVVADSLDQAKEDLGREWSTDRRLGWVIDTGTPMTDPLEAERSPTVARPMRDALRRGRLAAEREAILAVAPPDPAAHIRAAELQRRQLARERQDLAAGEGSYRDHPVSQALWSAGRRRTTLPASRATSPARVRPGPNAGGREPSWPTGSPSSPTPPVPWPTSAPQRPPGSMRRIGTSTSACQTCQHSVRHTSSGRASIPRAPVASITSPARSTRWTGVSATTPSVPIGVVISTSGSRGSSQSAASASISVASFTIDGLRWRFPRERRPPDCSYLYAPTGTYATRGPRLPRALWDARSGTPGRQRRTQSRRSACADVGRVEVGRRSTISDYGRLPRSGE